MSSPLGFLRAKEREVRWDNIDEGEMARPGAAGRLYRKENDAAACLGQALTVLVVAFGQRSAGAAGVERLLGECGREGGARRECFDPGRDMVVVASGMGGS
jgi:hypothetical protein